MFGTVSKLIFHKVIGWKVKGHFPSEIPKYIVIVAPHTSNLDFFVGVLARAFIKEIKDSKFLGKKELFQPPFGWIFRVTP